MREPAFWWARPGLHARLALPLSIVYGALARWRMNRQGTRAGIPVICVGNFTLGGTGKTPTAIAIARHLIALGEKPFFLSRGYGGTLAGPVRVDPAIHSAADVGDEPLLLARTAPVIVSHDRVQGAAFARSSAATVIVMDDGLQNPSLVKDLAIAVVDARRGLGNGMVFPSGPLRAPLQTQLAKTQAVLLIGKGAGATQAAELSRGSARAFLRGMLEPAPGTLKEIGRRKVFAFAGIGDPEKFFATVVSVGMEAQIEESYPDHHRYSEAEAASILARCESERLVAVTTEKDLVRMSRTAGAVARLAAVAKAIPVSLVFEDAESVKRLLRDALTKARAAP